MGKALYTQKNIPVFQNKVYDSFEEANRAVCSDVILRIHEKEGVVVNANFNPGLMDYDANYQNEQNYSPYFQQYIQEVLNKFNAVIKDKGSKIAEIGCGKGYFLELLHSKGFNVIGFDPTYEGDSPLVIKEYFDDRFSDMGIDVFLLRHTMEHIPDPFSFLHTIARANGYKGKIFIEVPTLDWIIEKKSFWDIFYEHCNYFTEQTFVNFFEKAETGRLFNGQYMYLYADLADLKKELRQFVIREDNFDFDFETLVRDWEKILIQHSAKGIAVWGAGAKGSTFLNLLDPQRTLVKYVVDINPRKQGKFIAHTGHLIISPEQFSKLNDAATVIIMNENYKDEIINYLNKDYLHYLTL
jgi:SAM-dependent methyltransferase